MRQSEKFYGDTQIMPRLAEKSMIRAAFLSIYSCHRSPAQTVSGNPLLRVFPICSIMIFLKKYIPYRYFSCIVWALAAAIIVVFSGPATAQSETYKLAYSAYQTQNFSKADALWRRLANEGDINAQYALDVMELRREAPNATPKKAFNWFNKVAVKGHSTAMFNVGVAYWEGSGVQKDREKALEWWQQSAEARDSGAQFNLGLAYYIGEEKDTSLAVAAKWIGMAAEQNHPEARKIYEILIKENPELAEAVETYSYWKTTLDSAIIIEPGIAGKIFYTLPESSPVEIIQSDNNWTKITLPEGLKTWVFEKFLSVSGSNGTITRSGVRVRQNPALIMRYHPQLLPTKMARWSLSFKRQGNGIKFALRTISEGGLQNPV